MEMTTKMEIIVLTASFLAVLSVAFGLYYISTKPEREEKKHQS